MSTTRGTKRTVEQRAKTYGKHHLGTEDLREVLTELYKEHSLDGIASLLGVTRQAIAHTMKQCEITLAKPGRPSAFLTKVRELDFDSVEDYFRARSISTFESMAEELGVSTSTVHRYHREFVKSVREAVVA